jgi:dual specificity MAP kinase phosphatase
MATLVVQQTAIRHSRSPPPLSSALTLDTSKYQSTPIPNKHLPYCSPGPAPSSLNRTPATPPASPILTKKLITQSSSTLYPADSFPKAVENPPIYSIEAADLAQALEEAATQPLPDPKLVFPWLHGLHPENQIQLAFFVGRRKALRKAPKGMRNITIVKAGGDLSKAKLKGALAPNELLSPMTSRDPAFYEADPKDGFSVRNFHIQPAKMAMVSDIVVYGDENTKRDDVLILAKKIARAQNIHRQKCDGGSPGSPVYNTFVVSSKSQIHTCSQFRPTTNTEDRLIRRI